MPVAGPDLPGLGGRLASSVVWLLVLADGSSLESVLFKPPRPRPPLLSPPLPHWPKFSLRTK